MIKKLLVLFIMIFSIINVNADDWPGYEQYYNPVTDERYEPMIPIEITINQAMELVNKIDMKS